MSTLPIESGITVSDRVGPPVSLAPSDFPPPAVGWYVAGLMAFLSWMSLLDRYIIMLLVDPIKSSLHLTDLQFGMINGLAFILCYTIFGFVFGVLADRIDRRKLIFFGVTIWSLASAACGLASSFAHLLLARAGLGAGEAALNPSATSMLSDLFPKHKLTSAMAVYTMGSSVGGGTAFIVGGLIVQWAAGLGPISVPILGALVPWQVVFLLIGPVGILFGLMVFSIKEPARRHRAGATAIKVSWISSYATLFRFMGQHKRFFIAHFSGFTIASMLLSGCVMWYPVHISRAFGWSMAQTGLALGLTLMVAGIIGKLACGWLVDAMYRGGRRDAQLRWYAACLMIATPIGVGAMMFSDAWLFLAGVCLFGVLVTPLPACAMAALNIITPNELRGVGVTVFTATVALIGGSLGAMIIPLLAQGFDGPTAIGMGMALLIGIVCPVASICLALGCRPMREAVAKVEEGVSF